MTVIVFDVRVKFILLSRECKSRPIEFLSNYFAFISHIRLRKGLADNLMKMGVPQMNVLSYSKQNILFYNQSAKLPFCERGGS